MYIVHRVYCTKYNFIIVRGTYIKHKGHFIAEKETGLAVQGLNFYHLVVVWVMLNSVSTFLVTVISYSLF